MAWIGLIEAGHPRVIPAARAGQGTDYLDQVTITWDESETGQGPAGTALRTRRPAVCANMATDPRFAPWREAALHYGFASLAAVPVLHGERLFGVVNVYADKPEAFDDEEISLLAELAGDLGFALQSIEDETQRKRAEREIESLARFPTENPNPVMRVEQDGRILYANAASRPLLRLWNCAVGEVLPLAWRDRVTDAAASDSRITVDVECGNQVYSILAAPIQAAGYVNLYGRDVTGRKHAEEALLESELKFHTLFDRALDGILIADMETRRFFMGNSAICQMLGYTQDELSSIGVDEIHPLEHLPYVVEQFKRQARGEIYLSEDIPVRRKDGSVFYADINSTLVTFSGHTYMMGVFRDITERKQAEEALRESEERYRLLVETLPDGVIVHSQGRVVFANPASATIIGAASPADLIGKPVIEFVHPDYRELALKRIQQSLSEGVPVPLAEEKFVRLDGTPIDVEVSAIPFSYAGQPAMLTVFNDITERKRAEEALRESEDKLKYVFDYSLVGKSITLPSGEINVNQAFCEMLGYTREELQNPRWQDITHPDDIELTRRAMDSLLSGEKESARFIKRYMHKGGAVVWTDVSSSLRRDKDGKPLYFITTLSDITERKQAEEEIKKQLDELQRWHNATLGRESRILDLKREVNELLGKAGQPPRYPSAESSDL